MECCRTLDTKPSWTTNVRNEARFVSHKVYVDWQSACSSCLLITQHVSYHNESDHMTLITSSVWSPVVPPCLLCLETVLPGTLVLLKVHCQKLWYLLTQNSNTDNTKYQISKLLATLKHHIIHCFFSCLFYHSVKSNLDGVYPIDCHVSKWRTNCQLSVTFNWCFW